MMEDEEDRVGLQPLEHVPSSADGEVGGSLEVGPGWNKGRALYEMTDGRTELLQYLHRCTAPSEKGQRSEHSPCFFQAPLNQLNLKGELAASAEQEWLAHGDLEREGFAGTP